MHPDWQNLIHVYCEKNSSKEPQFLQDVTAHTWRKMVNARQLSGHLQGRLLALLVSLKQPKCVLEIGTFTGYATACLTENLLPDAQIHTIEADQETAYKTKTFWKSYPFMNAVNWHSGEALSVIPTLNIQPDFIFVDADKHNYIHYFNLCLNIMPSGGIMLFDNTLWSGKVIDETLCNTDKDTSNMHEFNQHLAKCENWTTLVLPIRDGLTAVMKN